jgi:nitroimidazol reductase NimA-like FMN-containing flavoprotein (pyridoxamine 5'-phosphate oxidase superfamily)
MSAPTARLDRPYSDPSATPTSWDETCEALDAAELFWISTVRADGRPHVTPVVAVWAEGAVWFSTGDGEQKFANLRGNQHVVMTTGCNRWDGGMDVMVEGDAVQVTDEALLTRVAEVFASKWDGRWQWTVREGAFHSGEDSHGGAKVFRVTPVKVFTFAKGDTFGATRHQFTP